MTHYSVFIVGEKGWERGLWYKREPLDFLDRRGVAARFGRTKWRGRG
jgi:hypothetical protein